MSDGTVVVNGPVNGANGAIDYDLTFKLTEGTLICAGSSDMMQSVSDTSTQNTVAVLFDEYKEAGTIVNITDSSGKSILSFKPSKKFSSIVISTKQLINGSYSISLGGSDFGSEKDGLYDSKNYTDGTIYKVFEINNILTNIGTKTNTRNNMMKENINSDKNLKKR